MIRLRLGALLALAVAIGAFCHAPQAMAAPEVHRLNLVISANPSQLNGGSMNHLIERINIYPLGAMGYEPLQQITQGWLFDAELRYFVRPNFALAAGFGQIKTQSKQVYLPGIGAEVTFRGELLAVPIHLGALFYLPPYTQGDFQARTFLGGGLVDMTTCRATFSIREVNPANPNPVNVRLVAKGEGPGFYAEFGEHMFFAARYSVMVSAIYRSAKVTGLQQDGYIPVLDSNGQLVSLPDIDLGGIGVRGALGIGF